MQTSLVIFSVETYIRLLGKLLKDVIWLELVFLVRKNSWHDVLEKVSVPYILWLNYKLSTILKSISEFFKPRLKLVWRSQPLLYTSKYIVVGGAALAKRHVWRGMDKFQHMIRRNCKKLIIILLIIYFICAFLFHLLHKHTPLQIKPTCAKDDNLRFLTQLVCWCFNMITYISMLLIEYSCILHIIWYALVII